MAPKARRRGMPTRMRRRSRSVVVAILAITLLVGCSIEASPSPPNAAFQPFLLLSVATRGGECPGGPCGSLIDIGRDGSIHQVLPQSQVLGVLPKAGLDALVVEIERANFPLIASRPFTGQCPIAFDGQETIYTFHLSTGDVDIASCKVAIDPDHPLFLAIGAAFRWFMIEG